VRKEQKPDRERARSIKARQRAIGRELRRVYDNIAQEPVPDDFLDLLQKIDRADEGGKS
jgi:Anti-sigma factor NepR